MASRKHATRNAGRGRAAAKGSDVGHSVRKFTDVCLKVMLATFVSAGIYGTYFVVQTVVNKVSDQRVEQVRIDGDLKHVPKEMIEQSVSEVAGKSFLSIDLAGLKRDLEKTAWIREVSVQREWPETLIVHVTEQQAIARWNNTGLLNQYGEIFNPADMSSLHMLPLLEGPSSHEAEVMKQYQKFSQVLLPHGLKLSSLSLSVRGAWQMKLNNGVNVNIGKTDVVERLQRFTQVLDGDLLNGLRGVNSVDLRYQSGMAVSRSTEEDSMISSL